MGEEQKSVISHILSEMSSCWLTYADHVHISFRRFWIFRRGTSRILISREALLYCIQDIVQFVHRRKRLLLTALAYFNMT